ncbi:SpoIID/LytB domain-containing protein [Paenibacillus sp. CC-CFT747]|nr:SpoIID/LytB domain-containing protein [Paenibacillus sp. CC-CFT747]
MTDPLHEKIMAKNPAAGTIELELTGTLALAPGYLVQQTRNGQTLTRSLADVMVGAANVTVTRDEQGRAAKLVIEGETPADRMRVGIRRDIANIADNSTFDHTRLDLQSKDGSRLLDKRAGRSFDIAPGKLAAFTIVDGVTVVTVDGTELYRTANRLYAEQKDPSASLLQIMTFKRAQGNPLYRGTLELSLTAAKDKLRVVNDVTLEQYLYQVVPSEMPASFGREALKAQAVAARTYALTDYYSSRFADRGFHIDDSTLSQVFNNSAENDLTTQAVNETAGLIMKSGGSLVDARFYSTSGGFGASKHEVWSDTGSNLFPGTPIPYLTAKSYTYDPSDPARMLALDTADENAVNAFYKNLSYTGYDSDSLYFRWKVGLTRQELETTINKNLADRYAADPAFILTKLPDGSFASKVIPAEGIGTLQNLYVAKRGAGGNVTELVVEGTTGTYKIIKEFNIRFTIRPSKTYTLGPDILAYRAKGGSQDYDPAGTLKNPSILYSAFFTFDLAKDAAGAVTGVTFYGGGNGHGVGMSQYGASALGAKGWKFDQILNGYYSQMQLVTASGQPYEVRALELGGLGPMNPGETRQAQVKAVYNDGSRVDWTAGVTFTSSRPSVAAVSQSGLITAIGYGETLITVRYGDLSAAYPLSVASRAVSLEISGLAPMTAGETAQATVTAVYADSSRHALSSGVAFTSSSPQVAEVDATGTIRALSHGQTVITAEFEGRSAAYSLTVSPALTGLTLTGLAPMRQGDTAQAVVSAVYSDGSSVPLAGGVTFTSSQPSVAAVDEAGRVTALAKGETEITASYGGKTVSYRLVVTASLVGLRVDKLHPLQTGETTQLKVWALYSDNAVQEVTAQAVWTSSRPEVAAVAPGGLVTAFGKGKTQLTAVYAGSQASEELVVTKAPKGRSSAGNAGEEPNGAEEDR